MPLPPKGSTRERQGWDQESRRDRNLPTAFQQQSQSKLLFPHAQDSVTSERMSRNFLHTCYSNTSWHLFVFWVYTSVTSAGGQVLRLSRTQKNKRLKSTRDSAGWSLCYRLHRYLHRSTTPRGLSSHVRYQKTYLLTRFALCLRLNRK